jgi:hypothetical protein
MGAMQRNKGKAGELEIVHLLRAHGWDRAERTHDGRAQLARGDIRRGPEGVHIEVRRRPTTTSYQCSRFAAIALAGMRRCRSRSCSSCCG